MNLYLEFEKKVEVEVADNDFVFFSGPDIGCVCEQVWDSEAHGTPGNDDFCFILKEWVVHMDLFCQSQ